jgi:hypothetical protein
MDGNLWTEGLEMVLERVKIIHKATCSEIILHETAHSYHPNGRPSLLAPK